MFAINLIIVLLLVAANAFFVAAEFSLVAVRPTRLQQLKEAGSSGASVVEGLVKNIGWLLSGVQVGITIASLLLGWFGELTLARVFEPLLRGLEVPWAAAIAHTLAVTAALLAITTLHVVLGEQVPKNMGLQRAEKVALLVARPMVVFLVAFGPLIKLFDSATIVILRSMGFRAGGGHALVRSAEELRLLLEQVREYGVLDRKQARMLEGALELSELQVRQVMVPRTAILGLPVSASLEQAVAAVRQQPRSRYLVYEGASEQVVGVLHRKDLFLSLSERLERVERGELPAPFELRSLVREAFFVPENKPLAELLEDFRRKRLHVAVVVDEFGSVQGMVTLTDVVETIVGKVRDEHEAVPAPAPLTEGELVLDGRTSLLDLEHQHRIELPAGPGFETLAGFVLNRLGFIPQGGECFLHDGLRITVVEMDGRRVSRVKIEQIQSRATPAEAAETR